MIEKNDVIKLTKAIGNFDKVGCCFEVLDISEDGIVEFKNHFMGKGVMDLDAMNKCFEKANDDEKEDYFAGTDYDDDEDEDYYAYEADDNEEDEEEE